MSEERRGLILGYSGEGGIAHACAMRLRASGAEVAVATRPGRENAIRDAERFGFPHVTVDANDDEVIAAAVDHVGRWFNRLDYLVHAWVPALCVAHAGCRPASRARGMDGTSRASTAPAGMARSSFEAASRFFWRRTHHPGSGSIPVEA